MLQNPKNILLFYPPGEQFQRGEDRCQSNIKKSTATSMRACNDLGYMSAVLKNHNTFIRDYSTENASINDFIEDIKNFHPDYLILSTTNATIFYDLNIVKEAKKYCNAKVILKGAIFYDAPEELLSLLELKDVDILIGSEAEFLLPDIINQKELKEIPCIFYKENNKWHKNEFNKWFDNLDDLPFPDRNKMKNELYTRPDIGEPMATIQTSRGCPSACIYCLSPQISGKKIRYRSPENVMKELEECYFKYGIKNFFFKADTFTFNQEWTLKLCKLIKESELYGNISYTANSRVKPLSQEVLNAMADTGCFTIAFGFETGNQETMKKIKKGVTIEDNRKAVEYAKKAGIPVYGFYMIGFPWETKQHIKDTEKLIFELNCDFLEIHMALPYYGSQFYELCKQERVLENSSIGTDYFHSSTKGTKYLSNKELLKIRKHIILKYHLRPSYILKKLKQSKLNIKILKNYFKFGIRLILNLFR